MKDSFINNYNYNKTILMTPIERMKARGEFDLCFYTYQGKLTSIIEEFNHIPQKQEDKKKKDDKSKQDEKIKQNTEIVLNSFTVDKRNAALSGQRNAQLIIRNRLHDGADKRNVQ